ncbi:ATP-binding protein [Flavitalea sp. BT771]|uniref:ATP-binding protein n=1 Tax=Flavitalea sp. BT771 TaxID=3063329 RepID=UPI0026E343AF|nr:ATP-binding protein [Flavitalea sp. BT771]MDO6433038.1 ATP-binding protein [Flavitalea sp. BT771]MDV6221686.1 ATP-binding protein [Flavitalea sp. BT771]
MHLAIQKDSIFKVGKVISVEGRTVKVEVDKTKNSSHLIYNGTLLRNISVNSYVKITKGFTSIIGKVEGEFIIEDKMYAEKNYTSEKKKIKRILQVSLLGFLSRKGFERGIKELPLINNDCFLLEKAEFDSVHNFIKTSDVPIAIGTLTHEREQEITVGVNDLFASHIGIFGNTGSGKSYTLAKLYRELFKLYCDEAKFKQNAQFYFLDFNGEYVAEDAIIGKTYKNIYSLNTRKAKDKIPVAKSLINDYGFWALLLEATEKTQTPFLKRSINNEWLDDKIASSEALQRFIKELIAKVIDKEDKNLKSGVVIDLLNNVGDCIESNNLNAVMGTLRERLQFHTKSNVYYFTDRFGAAHWDKDAIPYVGEVLDELDIAEINSDVLTQIRLKIVLQYHHEIISGFSSSEHLAPLLKRIGPRISDLRKVIEVKDVKPKKNITVISFRDVNIHMRKMLPLIICKQLYETKKEENQKDKYLNIIIDEAHNILSSTSDRESETWKDYRLETFEEIIKEGRKFGVFLTIASQRPYDISATIISQLHNFFLHRLINNNDIHAVERSVSYLDRLSFDSLPILPTGTCILAGLSAQVPVMIDIGAIERQFEPDNKTMRVIDKWK